MPSESCGRCQSTNIENISISSEFPICCDIESNYFLGFQCEIILIFIMPM